LKTLSLIPLFLILASCASFSDYTLIDSEKDLYLITHKTKNKNFGAIRDKNNNLIRNKDRADKRFFELGSVDKIEKSEITNCDGSYELSKKFHKIDDLLSKNKSKKAREKLKELKKQCLNIEYHSNYYYLLAYSFHIDKNKEKRDFYLKEFINKSDSLYPNFAHQTNSEKESDTIYKKTITHSKEVLKGADFKLDLFKKEHLNTARYRNRLNSFLPGYENESGKVFFILPSYSTATRGGINLIYNITTDYGEFIPVISYTDVYGSQSSLIYRKRLSQSVDRKHTTGINLAVYQWRRIERERDEYGYYQTRNKGNGVGASFGYGGTYQLTNDFYYAYQGRYYSSYRNGALGTSLVGYNILDINDTESLSLEYGLFNNISIVGMRWGLIHFFQNLSGDTFNFQFHLGF